MRLRWVAAALGAVALTALTMTVSTRWASRTAKGPAEVGCPADARTANLDFTMKAMDGKDSRLSDYKGKVILLNFWATWCGPCKAEIPSLVELQAQYGDDLVVLGFSVDDPVEKMRPYAAQYKINYRLLVGNGREDVQEAFGPMYAIPVSVIIGRDGKIAKKHSGIATKAQIEREIKRLI
jgi:thiol-disulfide isomerase/thioredoxin